MTASVLTGQDGRKCRQNEVETQIEMKLEREKKRLYKHLHRYAQSLCQSKTRFQTPTGTRSANGQGSKIPRRGPKRALLGNNLLIPGLRRRRTFRVPGRGRVVHAGRPRRRRQCLAGPLGATRVAAASEQQGTAGAPTRGGFVVGVRGSEWVKWRWWWWWRHENRAPPVPPAARHRVVVATWTPPPNGHVSARERARLEQDPPCRLGRVAARYGRRLRRQRPRDGTAARVPGAQPPDGGELSIRGRGAHVKGPRHETGSRSRLEPDRVRRLSCLLRFGFWNIRSL